MTALAGVLAALALVAIVRHEIRERAKRNRVIGSSLSPGPWRKF
jgi:hypothetical protein